MKQDKTERWVKDRIKDILKSYGKRIWYFMPQGQYYGVSGIPDFVVCMDGKFLAVEAKTNYGKVSELQQRHLDDIKRAGGEALVVNESGLDGFRQFMAAFVGDE